LLFINNSEIETLLAMLEAIAQYQDPTDLALLQLLPQEQKAQLWAVVPVELRQNIHRLKQAG
jgi:hypothetical protein